MRISEEFKGWGISLLEDIPTYFHDYNIMVQGYPGGVKIRDLRNAFRAGYAVKNYKIYNNLGGWSGPALDFCLDRLPNALIDYLGGVVKNPDRCYHVGPIEISGDVQDGERVFSPFALEHLTPVNHTVKEWRPEHLARILANRQYTYLEVSSCFIKRSDAPGLNVARELIESPLGWKITITRIKDEIELSAARLGTEAVTLRF